MKIYEILVPTQFNCGKPIRTRYHRVWDNKVKCITGGLTILPPTINGYWESDDGELYAERMIPVRIMCTSQQIQEIAEMSLKYYEQKAIMYYEISNNVKIVK